MPTEPLPWEISHGAETGFGVRRCPVKERVTGTGTTELLHLRVGSGKNCCIELV